MNTNISMHFTVEELIASETAKKYGIDNRPGTQHLINMVYLCAYVLEPLRVAMKRPIKISSGYRCEALNKKVGGVKYSQHMKGQAADINIEGDMAFGRTVFEYIRKHLTFDQLIWEHSGNVYWVHVSYVYPDFGKNRKQVIENLVKK